jgi:hypothetical protein
VIVHEEGKDPKEQRAKEARETKEKRAKGSGNGNSDEPEHD